MDITWQRYVDLATDFTQVTQKRAEQIVRALVRRGEVEASKGEKTVEDLLDWVDQNRKAISGVVKSELEEAVRRLGLARQPDIEQLQAKISHLEATIRSLGETSAMKSESPPSPPTGQPDARAFTPDETEES